MKGAQETRNMEETARPKGAREMETSKGTQSMKTTTGAKGRRWARARNVDKGGPRDWRVAFASVVYISSIAPTRNLR